MKAWIVTLTVALSLTVSAWADVAGYTKVPAGKLEEYTKAIYAAIAQNPKSVSNCDPRWIQQTMDTRNEILVSNSHSQPLLLVNNYYPVNDGVLHRMAITTSPDLKQITQVFAEIYVMGEVNQGDLAHPVIVQDYILQNRVNCTAQNQN